MTYAQERSLVTNPFHRNCSKPNIMKNDDLKVNFVSYLKNKGAYFNCICLFINTGRRHKKPVFATIFVEWMNHRSVRCVLCKGQNHIKSAKITPNEYRWMRQVCTNTWSCHHSILNPFKWNFLFMKLMSLQCVRH